MYNPHCGRKFTYVYSAEMQERIKQERLAIAHRINRIEQYHDLEACVRKHRAQANASSWLLDKSFIAYLAAAAVTLAWPLLFGRIGWGSAWFTFFLFCCVKWSYLGEWWHTLRGNKCAETLHSIDISDISKSAFTVH